MDITSIDTIKDLEKDEIETKTQDIIHDRLYERTRVVDHPSESISLPSKVDKATSYERVRKSFIDTSTETIDEELMDEVEARMKEIIKEELLYKTKTKKKDVEKEIVDFINAKSESNTPMTSIADEYGNVTQLETTEQ